MQVLRQLHSQGRGLCFFFRSKLESGPALFGASDERKAVGQKTTQDQICVWPQMFIYSSHFFFFFVFRLQLNSYQVLLSFYPPFFFFWKGDEKFFFLRYHFEIWNYMYTLICNHEHVIKHFLFPCFTRSDQSPDHSSTRRQEKNPSNRPNEVLASLSYRSIDQSTEF